LFYLWDNEKVDEIKFPIGGCMAKVTDQEAREYHRLNGKPGKIAVVPTKPMDTQRDLSLAYTPGVAVPVLDIEKDPEAAYEYTSKGNLVAVITNGTAILGLGDRGALSWKARACCSRDSPMWMCLISKWTAMTRTR
jgi:hypothetical protein